MRITDPSHIGSASGQNQTESVKGTSQTGAAAGLSGLKNADFTGTDEVSLSGVSKLLQTSASEREQRIAALTASVRSGQYNVPAAAVGRSLVSETLARSGRP